MCIRFMEDVASASGKFTSLLDAQPSEKGLRSHGRRHGGGSGQRNWGSALAEAAASAHAASRDQGQDESNDEEGDAGPPLGGNIGTIHGLGAARIQNSFSGVVVVAPC